MKFQTVKINDLHESEYNPRVKLEKGTKEYKKIEASIREFGIVEPIVVNEDNMAVIGGHQRLRVMSDMGIEEVDCTMVSGLTPEKEKALCLALNRIKGEWDMEKLSHLLSDEDVSIFPTGFEIGEIDLSQYLPSEEEKSLEEDGNSLETYKENDDENTEAPPEPEEANTTISIAGYKFKVSAERYHNLISSIMDEGKFTENEIKEELKRRILNG